MLTINIITTTANIVLPRFTEYKSSDTNGTDSNSSSTIHRLIEHVNFISLTMIPLNVHNNMMTSNGSENDGSNSLVVLEV